jgi:hypothetical protein
VLRSVPGASSSLGFPATETLPGRIGCLKWRWLPRVASSRLITTLVQDDPGQATAASALLEQAELVAVPLPVLCELVWVLRRVYRFNASVRTDRPAVRAGLQLLAAGGDQLATFDQEAARLLVAAREPVHLLR